MLRLELRQNSKRRTLEMDPTEEGTLDGWSVRNLEKQDGFNGGLGSISTPNPLQPKGINLKQADMFKYQLQKVVTPAIGSPKSVAFDYRQKTSRRK